MTDKPWFRFYPVDWRGDAKLKVCSLAARGLWIELMAIMHEGTPYGHLMIGGAAPSDGDLCKLLGVPVGTVRKALAELEHRGVALRTEGGVVFSKRMVRDAERAETDAVNGRKGGNPQVKGWVNPPVNAAGGRALTHPGNGNGSSSDSGVEALSGVEPEKGPALALVVNDYELSPGQLQAAVPGLVGAWNNIAASVQPFVAVTLRSHPKATAALRAHPQIDWWSAVFSRVAASDFLRGLAPFPDGRPFVADFLWCLTHADEIAGGRYDNRERSAPLALPTKGQQRSARNAASTEAVIASLRAEGAI